MLRGVEATVTLKMTELFSYDLPEVGCGRLHARNLFQLGWDRSTGWQAAAGGRGVPTTCQAVPKVSS